MGMPPESPPCTFHPFKGPEPQSSASSSLNAPFGFLSEHGELWAHPFKLARSHLHSGPFPLNIVVLYSTGHDHRSNNHRSTFAVPQKMVFLPDKTFGQLGTVPGHIPISEFILNEQHGRVPHNISRDPFTCGLSGRSYSSREVVDRVEFIACALAKELGWGPNQGTEWDKTLAVFTLNTVGQPQHWHGKIQSTY